jgi:hypothetical protein
MGLKATQDRDERTRRFKEVWDKMTPEERQALRDWIDELPDPQDYKETLKRLGRS